MYINFVNKYLSSIRWADEKEKEDLWQVEGIITKHSNQVLKFDISFLKSYDLKIGKRITGHNKSDKILMENNKDWILLDTEELIQYAIKHKLKEILLEELMNKLDWNIILPK